MRLKSSQPQPVRGVSWKWGYAPPYFGWERFYPAEVGDGPVSLVVLIARARTAYPSHLN